MPTNLTLLVIVDLLALAWSFTGPSDLMTWVMEVAPFLIVLPILLFTAKKFPLTPLLYGLITVHAVILMVGGRYTYAEVPVGFWVKDALGLARNHYDRLGHFAQGFIPAIAAREVLLRTSPLRPGKWLFFLVTCVCLAVSALYELIEWWTSVAQGASAEAFLGTQGDVWDPQWDMFCCLVGALLALLFLSKFHDGQIARLPPKHP